MDQIGRYFQDNGVLILILVVLLIFTALAFLLFLRILKRSRQEDDFASGRLFDTDHDSQFSAAIEKAQFLKSHEDVARHIAAIFNEHFSIPLLAIYAGKAGDEHLMNVLPGDQVNQAESTTGRTIRLPDSLSSAALQAFPRPQMTIAAEFTGAGYQEPPGETGTLVAVLPWRGAFFWGGILIGQPSQPIDPEVFSALPGPLSLLGDRLGVALEFEKELEGSRGTEDLVRKTFEFARSVASSADEPAPLSAIAREVASLIGTDSAAIWRVDPASSMAQMEGSYGLQSEDFLPLPVGQGLAGHIAETRQPLALEDAPSDPRCLFPREARESGIVSYMGAPIISEDRTIGVVEAHTSQPRAWNELDLSLLESAARFIASAMRRSDTHGDRLQVENAYLKLSEALQRLRTRDELMEAAVEVLGHALGVSRAIAIELNDSGKAEPVRYEVRAADIASFSGTVPDEEFISKAMSETSKAEVVAIDDSLQQSLMNAQQVESMNVLSEMIVPVKVNDHTKGFIYLHQCDHARQWQDDECGFASRVGRQLSLSLANLRAMEQAAAESEAAREEARLAAAAASRAQTLVASLPEAVIGLDQEGRLTFFNAT
ncbi:MAG TPA: GAF domain-containing protein, partial [Blastocatellia bacterium]|nr:GAF domain-containing protein [Blastocatellia bacterium]